MANAFRSFCSNKWRHDDISAIVKGYWCVILVRFSNHNSLILKIVPFQTVLIIPFINKLEIRVYSTLNFSIVIMSKENLRVVCVAREFTSFHDEQEIVDENIKYQRPEDWSLGNPSGDIIPARIFSGRFQAYLISSQSEFRTRTISFLSALFHALVPFDPLPSRCSHRLFEPIFKCAAK